MAVSRFEFRLSCLLKRAEQDNTSETDGGKVAFRHYWWYLPLKMAYLLSQGLFTRGLLRMIPLPTPPDGSGWQVACRSVVGGAGVSLLGPS
ncbi:unnamed protein product [Nezara viridula]|uniref:Uncharacterized protein n=1 Tax=Nezara viridula TaxID=85310 RepID=A0A9P0HJU7_NEZVI|nr:unnamed protein product [Nezara viridula]